MKRPGTYYVVEPGVRGEFECIQCGEPNYAGDRAFHDEASNITFCSAGCARAWSLPEADGDELDAVRP